MLWTLDPHSHFHDSAAGMNSANQAQIDQEAAAQTQLATTLAQMQSTFEQQGDTASATSTAAYRTGAEARATLLRASSCQLAQMTAADLDAASRMSSFLGMKVPNSSTTGQGSNDNLNAAAVLHPSDVKQAAEGFAAPTGDSSIQKFANSTDEILSSFELGAKAEPVENLSTTEAGVRDKDCDLFTRAHKKYQQYEARGVFQNGFLDRSFTTAPGVKRRVSQGARFFLWELGSNEGKKVKPAWAESMRSITRIGAKGS